jgi:hypothetical protein
MRTFMATLRDFTRSSPSGRTLAVTHGPHGALKTGRTLGGPSSPGEIRWAHHHRPPSSAAGARSARRPRHALHTLSVTRFITRPRRPRLLPRQRWHVGFEQREQRPPPAVGKAIRHKWQRHPDTIPRLVCVMSSDSTKRSRPGQRARRDRAPFRGRGRENTHDRADGRHPRSLPDWLRVHGLGGVVRRAGLDIFTRPALSYSTFRTRDDERATSSRYRYDV